jgi:putative ABC transport system ATP-binding protein
LKEGKIVSTKNSKPNIKEHIIELHNVEKSYTNTDVVTPVLKGIDLTLDRGDFIVILGPSGSGKTTLLNTISGLDKVSEGDVFVLGANLSLLKDSHLTRFRRDYVGFIFQQYNLLTNLTAKENAEVGENLSRQKHKDLTIEDIFETIGMDNNNVSQSHVPWLKTQKSFSGMNQLERLMKKWDDVFYKFLLILIKNTKQQLLLLLITRTSLILLTQLFMLKTD